MYLDSNANVGALKGRSIVDSIARHPAAEPELAQALHNEVLVFRVYLPKVVGWSYSK